MKALAALLIIGCQKRLINKNSLKLNRKLKKKIEKLRLKESIF